MKNYAIFLLLILSACKTRLATTAKTNTIDRTITTHVVKNNSIKTDSIKTIAHTLTAQTERDSVEIDIIPDTGTIRLSNGNFTGKARQIIIKGTRVKAQLTNRQLQQTSSETAKQNQNDSTVQKTNVATSTKSKQVIVKGFAFSWVWIALFLIAGTGGFVVYKKYKLW